MAFPKYRPKDPINNKVCSYCGIEKVKTEFYSREGGRLKSACKDCVNQLAYEKEKQNPIKAKAKHKKYIASLSQQNLWARAVMGRHKQKGIKFNFHWKDLEQLAYQVNACPICDQAINWDNNKVCDNSPTLENLNCKSELNLEDIAIWCYSCNRTKQDRTWQEFLDHCALMVSKFSKNLTLRDKLSR